MTDPYPKSRQLARGERRYRRKVASPKQWQAIIAEKGAACRLDAEFGSEGAKTLFGRPVQIEYHHLVSRAKGGDDVADNIVPLCRNCHEAITRRKPMQCQALARSLTDAEYAYVIGKLGEGALERLFGV